jgi:hypothetical protein
MFSNFFIVIEVRGIGGYRVEFGVRTRLFRRVMSMTKVGYILVVFLLCLSFASGLQAQESVAGQRDVEVGVFLIDIEQINSVTQSFIANLYLDLRWQDPSLAHDGPDSISRALDEIWHPRMQILNQQRLVRTFPEEVEIEPDGQVIYRQRVWGGFSQQLELEDFPFDSQRLEFTLIAVGFGSSDIRYQAFPGSGVSNNLTMPDWAILGWDFAPVTLNLDNGSSQQKAMVFGVDVKRYYSFFILKVIFPLMLIVAMSWLVFWIDPSLAASQISVSVTAMLTMIAYRFAIGGMLPRLPFLTHMDYFVMASTVVVFLCLIEVVYTAHLAHGDQLEKARRIDLHARWIAPLAYVLVVLETLYFQNWL